MTSIRTERGLSYTERQRRSFASHPNCHFESSRKTSKIIHSSKFLFSKNRPLPTNTETSEEYVPFEILQNKGKQQTNHSKKISSKPNSNYCIRHPNHSNILTTNLAFMDSQVKAKMNFLQRSTLTPNPEVSGPHFPNTNLNHSNQTSQRNNTDKLKALFFESQSLSYPTTREIKNNELMDGFLKCLKMFRLRLSRIVLCLFLKTQVGATDSDYQLQMYQHCESGGNLKKNSDLSDIFSQKYNDTLMREFKDFIMQTQNWLSVNMIFRQYVG